MDNGGNVKGKQRNRLVTNYVDSNMEIEDFTEWLDKTIPDEEVFDDENQKKGRRYR